MRTRHLFITGTDTGVGKTTIGCALAGAWRRAGHRVAVLKPIETGCVTGPAGLIPDDAVQLAEAAGQEAPVELLCPNRFEIPTSPEAAARASGRPVDLDAIRAAHRTLAKDADLLIVEGAGGLLVPIGPRYTMAELAADLGATLLVVARASLGTINHTLLTLEVARGRGLPLAGVMLNRPLITSGPDEATNAEAIARHGAVRVFGVFPHVPAAPLDRLAALAEKHLDLQGLWEAL